jgi:hypothetical protein
MKYKNPTVAVQIQKYYHSNAATDRDDLLSP